MDLAQVIGENALLKGVRRQGGRVAVHKRQIPVIRDGHTIAFDQEEYVTVSLNGRRYRFEAGEYSALVNKAAGKVVDKMRQVLGR